MVSPELLASGAAASQPHQSTTPPPTHTSLHSTHNSSPLSSPTPIHLFKNNPPFPTHSTALPNHGYPNALPPPPPLRRRPALPPPNPHHPRPLSRFPKRRPPRLHRRHSAPHLHPPHHNPPPPQPSSLHRAWGRYWRCVHGCGCPGAYVGEGGDRVAGSELAAVGE